MFKLKLHKLPEGQYFSILLQGVGGGGGGGDGFWHC